MGKQNINIRFSVSAKVICDIKYNIEVYIVVSVQTSTFIFQRASTQLQYSFEYGRERERGNGKRNSAVEINISYALVSRV